MNDIDKAAQIIKEGGIVIFPTDTAFGIGCRLDREDSIKRLFKLRKRPETQATPVLFENKKQVLSYFEQIDETIEKLMNRYWPGALTIVYLCKTKKVPSRVRGGGKTLGARVPNNNVVLDIIKKTGVPLLGPSANFHGDNTPFSFQDLNPELMRLVDYVVKGETRLKKASTVIDCSVIPWEILRQGEVVIE